MVVFSWDDVTQGRVPWRDFSPAGTALTVGTFDGVHRGHGAIFDLLLGQKPLAPGVVTFVRPPAAFSQGASFPGLVYSWEKRTEILQQKGFSFVIGLDFSEKFRKIEGDVFLKILADQCGMKFLAEGTDFHLGFQGAFDAGAIEKIAGKAGFRFQAVPPVLCRGERIASSRVRQAILDKDYALAEEMLGRTVDPSCGLL
jgi:FAD synthase